jgi:hypothetical protein
MTTPARHATVAAMAMDGDKLLEEAAESRQMAASASNQQIGISGSAGWSKLAREADELKGKKPWWRPLLG